MRAIFPGTDSVNQRFWSGPAMIIPPPPSVFPGSVGNASALTSNSSRCEPVVSIFPIWSRPPLGWPCSVNQRLPSGPAAIVVGGSLTEYSRTAPVGVIRPTFRFLTSVNQTLPSGPNASPDGFGVVPITGYSVTSPRLELPIHEDARHACDPIGQPQVFPELQTEPATLQASLRSRPDRCRRTRRNP